MIALGKLMNPITRSLELQSRDGARHDRNAAAIEARPAASSMPDEVRVLQQVLTDLRLNYVDALKKSGAPATPES